MTVDDGVGSEATPSAAVAQASVEDDRLLSGPGVPVVPVNEDAEEAEFQKLLSHPFTVMYRQLVRSAAVQVRKAEMENALAAAKVAELRHVAEAFAAGAGAALLSAAPSEMVTYSGGQSAAEALQECMDKLNECGDNNKNNTAGQILCATQYTACLIVVGVHGPKGDSGGGVPPKRKERLQKVLQYDTELEDPPGHPYPVDHGGGGG
ncbi:hypothetical protein SAMN05660350_04900 [Geodermatophilus obscurus]|uniref:Uncharacterized protein n=1 Tax=Geodermatophilus obscurus TaxID=1861 RepID=A0A1M7V124_9ACTN|nr:hypothetical protein [Geodermatophilus obscurus]SHN88909.1 hypothetical protein SAMN05660350_04900 [Geodermatophilus obscurus]